MTTKEIQAWQTENSKAQAAFYKCLVCKWLLVHSKQFWTSHVQSLEAVERNECLLKCLQHWCLKLNQRSQWSMLQQRECAYLAWTAISFGQVLPVLHIQNQLRFATYSSSLWFSMLVLSRDSDPLPAHDQDNRSKQCLGSLRCRGVSSCLDPVIFVIFGFADCQIHPG